MKIEVYLKHLKELARMRPQYADVHNHLGNVLSYLGRNAEALAALGKALEANPQYVEAGVSRCFILADEGRVEEAFREFKNLHVRSPHNLTVLLSLGIFCMRHGWRESGLAQILRAVEMNPLVPFLLAYAAAAHLEVGDEDSAHRQAENARAAYRNMDIDLKAGSGLPGFPDLDIYRKWENPYTSWRIHLLLANFSAEQEDFKNAHKEFLIVQLLFPGYVGTMVGLGRIALAQNRNEEAETWFSRAAVLNPESHTALINLGFIYADNGNLGGAVETFRAAVERRPLFPDYHYHLGTFLMEMGKINESITEFERALTINPRYGVASLLLGKAYLAKDDPERALAVLEVAPWDDWPEMLVLAARAYSKMGKRKEAAESLRKAIAIDPANPEAKELLHSVKGS